MSVSSRVPVVYQYIFTWYDPIVTAWGAWMSFTDPQTVVDFGIPNTPRNPDLDMFFQQSAGWMLGLCFMQVMLLRATDDLRVWKLFQYGTLVIDLVMIYSLHWSLSGQGRLAVSSLRSEDWTTIFITMAATLYRLAFVAELGFKSVPSTRKNL